MTMSKALIVGFGGIGQNVYAPELSNLGYDITTVDQNGTADYVNVEDVVDIFDVAVIATPNFTHESIARSIASSTKHIFIEKPGLENAEAWKKLCNDFPDTRFYLVKNNLYRNSYGLTNQLDSRAKKIKIQWIRKDGVPTSPWFTKKDSAWGGVEYDLFPHMYSYLLGITRGKTNNIVRKKCKKFINGYEVATRAEDYLMWGDVEIEIIADWKAGYNDASITVLTDTEEYKWYYGEEFGPFKREDGACPNHVYGSMIKNCINDNYEWQKNIDIWIHKQIEGFKYAG